MMAQIAVNPIFQCQRRPSFQCQCQCGTWWELNDFNWKLPELCVCSYMKDYFFFCFFNLIIWLRSAKICWVLKCAMEFHWLNALSVLHSNEKPKTTFELLWNFLFFSYLVVETKDLCWIWIEAKKWLYSVYGWSFKKVKLLKTSKKNVERFFYMMNGKSWNVRNHLHH